MMLKRQTSPFRAGRGVSIPWEREEGEEARPR